MRIFPAHSGTTKGRTKSIEKAKEERLAETKLRESATLDNSAVINSQAKNINDLNDYTLMYIFDLVDNIINKTKFERGLLVLKIVFIKFLISFSCFQFVFAGEV